MAANNDEQACCLSPNLDVFIMPMQVGDRVVLQTSLVGRASRISVAVRQAVTTFGIIGTTDLLQML
ncbi:MAG: hypothetical protein AAGN15_01515 [Cyanobacteria bacterium J06581_3]